LIDGKGRGMVLHHLLEGTLRFGEMRLGQSRRAGPSGPDPFGMDRPKADG